jgi:hypothetical protein
MNNQPPTRRPADLDLSRMSSEELDELRDRLVQNARRGGRFEPTMATDEGSFFVTDDVAFNPWSWQEIVIRAISESATRIAAAHFAAASATAASQMFQSGNKRAAWATLGASGAAAAGFTASAVRAGRSNK